VPTLHLGLQDDRASVLDAVHDYISTRRPTIFVLENVKNLVSRSRRDAFNYIIRLLRDLGEYWIDSRVYSSLSYGVPQNRERLYIIGVKESAITSLQHHSKRRTYKSLIWEAYTRRQSIIDYLGPSTSRSKTIFGLASR
jgi:site-specific DNA-cytosine methylase